jgi:ABC-type cobalamin/Fe3+-siderophores transport system ATPase subunit
MDNVPPVVRFDVSDLADVIVLAGPNGVGKTRLAQALFNAFRSPGGHPNIRLIVDATSQAEKAEWAMDRLDTSNPAQAQLLVRTIHKARKRTHWESSVFQIESDRGNMQYNPFGFSWDALDPWEEMMGWESGLSGIRSRYSDTVASLFRKIHSLDAAIARRGRELIAAGGGRLEPGEFPDPIRPFKDAFRQLLAPKELVDPDPKTQTLFFTLDGVKYPVSVLSSGEREVVNIAFDFLLRDPTDSIIVFDEPELHLHPELSYKLLHTLRNAGLRNQFIFVTHSPDIITASLEHSVVFVGPPKGAGINQAVVVRENDATNEALRLIGQSIGIVSLGRRIVLIEGGHTSLDKQTYGAILKIRFPKLVLVPSGGRGLIRAFQTVVDEVLMKTLWGVDFFMLCDRDALPLGKDATGLETKAGGRLRVLRRYHLENYFLDEDVLAKLFAGWEPPTSWLCDPIQVRQKLLDIARDTVSYATALTVAARYREEFGNLDLMVKGCHGKTIQELSDLVSKRIGDETARFSATANKTNVLATLEATFKDMEQSLTNDSWKELIPGKSIVDRFASEAGVQPGRLKVRFLAECEHVSPHPFIDVIQIFADFETA